MFSCLIFKATVHATKTQELIPALQWGPCKEDKVKLAGQGTDLISLDQASSLLVDFPLAWVTEEISREIECRNCGLFLMSELRVAEIEPAAIAGRFSETFLVAQADDWIARLYSFLHQHEAIWRQGGPLTAQPIIRLEDGKHEGLQMVTRLSCRPARQLDFTVRADLCRYPQR